MGPAPQGAGVARKSLHGSSFAQGFSLPDRLGRAFGPGSLLLSGPDEVLSWRCPDQCRCRHQTETAGPEGPAASL